MARVTGPLMSMDASGTIAGALTFSRWKGLPYVRRHAIPSNPRLPKQISVRAMFAFLARYWTLVAGEDQAEWAVKAETMHQSGFNRYIAANQKWWSQFLCPSVYWDHPMTGTPPGKPDLDVTAGRGEVTIKIQPGTPNCDFAYLIFAALGATVAPAFDNLIGVVAFNGTISVFVQTPLAAGAYAWIARPCMLTGLPGTDSDIVTDTVT